jgi:membrane protease YdiL (CAAX protease family)
LCSAIFAVWHVPAYFSVYSGGAGQSGWTSVALMVVLHGVSVVPICILYLTTRELYGVSLYHALIDVIQYCIIRNPAMGEASKDAVYTMTVRNETAVDAISWAWQIAGILLMMGLCRIAKRWTLSHRSD